MNTPKRKGGGFFILGVAILAVGLAARNTAVWTIGLVLAGFALLSARRTEQP